MSTVDVPWQSGLSPTWVRMAARQQRDRNRHTRVRISWNSPLCATELSTCGVSLAPSAKHERTRGGRQCLNLFQRWREYRVFLIGALLRKSALLACASIALMVVAPASSRADAVGAAFGAGTGLVVAGPPGAIVGGVVGCRMARTPTFWGPPNSPHSCWIDNSFYRHCRYYNGRWHYY